MEQDIQESSNIVNSISNRLLILPKDIRKYLILFLPRDLNVIWTRTEGFNDLIKKTEDDWEAACKYATLGDNILLLDWIFVNGTVFGSTVISIAVRKGYLDVLKWMKNKHIINKYDKNSPLVAESMISPQNPDFSTYGDHIAVSYIAAEKGFIHILRWMKQNRIYIGRHAFVSAAKAGNLNTLAWFRDNDPDWDPVRVFQIADSYGYHDIINWINTVGWYPKSSHTYLKRRRVSTRTDYVIKI